MKKYQFIVVWFLLVILDQLSKYYLFNMRYLSNYEIFEPVMNRWISFSRSLSYLLVVPLTLIALWVFIYLLRKKEISFVIFVLLCAGTVGNLLDRVIYNAVRDFIVMFDRFVYNISDLYLSLAGVMIVVWIESGTKTLPYHS